MGHRNSRAVSVFKIGGGESLKKLKSTFPTKSSIYRSNPTTITVSLQYRVG